MPRRLALCLCLPLLGACTRDTIAGLDAGPLDAPAADGAPSAPDPASPAGWSWEQQVVTDATWLVDGTMPAAVVKRECVGNQWPRLPPAQWIWRAPCASTDRETRFFLKTFRLPEAPQFAQLEVAVDDYAYLEVNDRRLPVDCTLNLGAAMYGPASVCGYAMVLADDVVSLLGAGDNTIRVILHNAPNDTSGDWTNPAGLTVRLTVKGGRRTGQ
jgi:hypothetical protein